MKRQPLIESPTRWEAQADAVNMLFSAKTQSNPESAVGLMNMAGKGPEVLTTLSTDFGKLLDGIHRTKIRGNAHLATAIQIAAVSFIMCSRIANVQLALKHRQNKSQRPRIILFSCSPISEEEKALVTLALKMRKLNISIDVVAFGDLEPNDIKKLQAFNDKMQGGDGSHFEIVRPGPSLLSDRLISTPILAGDGVVPRGGDGDVSMGGDTGEGFEFGIDPSTDPELALALRMSMEEEKARQESGKAGEPAKEPTLEDIAEEEAERKPLLDDKDKPDQDAQKEDKSTSEKMDTS